MRKTVFTLFMALVIPAAALAQGFPGGGPGQGGPGMRGPGGQAGAGPRMAEELDLTDEQVSRVREIHGKNRKAMIDLKAVIQKAMLDLTDELQKDKPDKAVVDKSIDQIVKTKAEMERTRLNAMVEAAAILTPEQKKKAAAKMAGANFMGGGPGGPGFSTGRGGPGGPGFQGGDE